MADGPNIQDLDTEEELNKVLEQRTQILNDLSAAYAEEGKAAKQAVAAEIAYIDAKERGSSQLEFYEKVMKEANKKLVAHEKEIQKALLAEELFVRALRDQQKAVQAAEAEMEQYTKGIVETGKSLEKLAGIDMSKFLKFGKSLKDTRVNLSQLASSAIGAMTSTIDLGVQMGRSRGFFVGFNKEIHDLAENNKALSLTNEKLYASYGSLAGGLTNFLSLSRKQRDSVALLTVDFDKFGVSTDETAKLLDSMTYAFGLSTASSLEAAEGLKGFAKDTGRPLQGVVQDLSGMSSQLARFGKRGPEVFKRLGMQARRLGLTIKDAFDLTEQFDTFESAANVAGRLNAQLGMQLNSVEIMSASSEDRLGILREEFKLQGLNFQSMGRRQKQMVAEIVAGGDVEKAARLFGAKVDVKKTEDYQKMTAKTLSTIAERTQASQDNFFRPMTEHMGKLVTPIAEMQKYLNFAQPALLIAIAAASALQTGMQFANMRNATNAARTTAGSSATIARAGGAGGPKPPGPITKSGAPDMRYKANREFVRQQGGPAAKPSTLARGAGFAKGIGIGGAVTGAVSAYQSASAEYAETGSAARATTKGILSGGGAMAGMAAGAAIGSIIPGAGTIIGGLAGLVLGSAGAYLGSNLGSKAADALMGSPKGKEINQSAKKATNAALEQRKEHKRSLESMDRVVQARAKQPINMQGNIMLDKQKVGTFVTDTINTEAGIA